MNKKIDSRYIANIGLLSCFAIIISYIEFLIPIPIGIPGIKLGLANVMVVLALYFMDGTSALFINVIRIGIVGMLFGNLFSIIFSLAGAIVSFIAMVLVKKIKGISILGVSICGGVCHNLGQILIARIIVDSAGMMYYAPVLIVAGIVTGLIIGMVAGQIYVRISRISREE